MAVVLAGVFVGDFVRAVGGWWVEAVLLVLGIAWIVVLEPGSLPAGVVVTVVGMIIVLVGAPYKTCVFIFSRHPELLVFTIENQGAGFR